MKILKRTVLLMLGVMIALLTPACTETNVEASGPISNDVVAFNADLATVIQPGTVAGEVIIESDYNGTAYVVNPEILTRLDANHQGQRIFYTYRETEAPAGKEGTTARYIEILSLQKILTKEVDILKEGEEDVYGHDPIYFSEYNIGPTHLTLEFQIFIGTGSTINHRISLVVNEGEEPDADGYVDVELRHNAEGDKQETISAASYVSFALDSVPGYKEGTLKGFRMAYTSINYEKETVTIGYYDSKSITSLFPWEEAYNTKIK